MANTRFVATVALLAVAGVFLAQTTQAQVTIVPTPDLTDITIAINKFCLLNPGKPCNSTNLCFAKSVCKDGKCVGIASKICKDIDNIACTVAACDPKVGCYHKPIDSKCPDTDLDKCTIPKCDPKAGCIMVKKNCDDKNPCTRDYCNPNTGACVNDPKPFDGQECDDGNACTTKSLCRAGKCVPVEKLVCKDDNNPCTKDTCDPKKGCIYTPTPGFKECDGNVCTLRDQCTADGKCIPGTVKRICKPDGKPCTSDECHPTLGCYAPLSGVPCDDGIKCTVRDTCVEGQCVGSPVDSLCNDNNACTRDVCTKTGCRSLTLPDGTGCDSNSCTADKCVNGKCIITPILGCVRTD